MTDKTQDSEVEKLEQNVNNDAPVASTDVDDVASHIASDTENVGNDDDGASEYEAVSVVKSPAVKLEDELKQSFIDYAMSVIVDRALPDVRDGLKPVHRRVLYDMYDLKMWHHNPTKKSARVVGDVIGRFHPHGDAAVYETIVRMAQWFSMRAPLIFGQGNFGNIDGDGAAAMRYTEVRMTKIAEMMLADIDKETVNSYPNYDGNEQIPEVLPTRFPNLLVNGSSGIAVGMATNIPPHNLAEVIDASIAMLENPNITLDELMTYIPGPDFPTGGLIIKSPDIRRAYETGRGRCIIRARTHTETDKQGRTTIYVDEIPYMENKSAIVSEIAALVREKKIEGIAEVNDLSDKDNLVRIAIDLKRDAYEEAVLNNLYQHTKMQSSFSFNVIALVNNRPKQLSLHEILSEFIKFRREVVTRRTVYLLRKDRNKAFINEGLIVAKSNIEKIVEMVMNAQTPEDAANMLMAEEWDGTLVSSLIELDNNGVNICLPVGIEPGRGLVNGKYHLSKEQATAILSLQLNRLTHLATEEIQNNYNSLKQNIHNYLEILNSTERMNQVIREELIEAKDTFKDPRRSSFINEGGSISKADLISRQAVLVTLSQEGYIKYQDLSVYEATSRGTKGNSAAKLKEEDYIVTSCVCNSHDNLLCFTNKGRCFVTQVYELPTSTNRTWRGRPIQNIFDFQENEKVSRLLPMPEVNENEYIVFATAKGGVKRSLVKEFKSHIGRSNNLGIKAINLDDDDELVAVEISHGEDDIILFSSNGRVLRFCEYVEDTKKDAEETVNVTEAADIAESSTESEDDETISDADRIARELNDLKRYLSIRKSGGGIRARGRNSGTNKGIKLLKDASVAAMLVVPASELENEKLNYLIITDKGDGKRGRLISIVGRARRGSQGLACSSKAVRGERIVSVISAHEDSDYLVFSNTGTVMRSRVSDITPRSRTAGFIRLKRLDEGEVIVGMQEISPDVVAAINESAEARAAEKRRLEDAANGVLPDDGETPADDSANVPTDTVDATEDTTSADTEASQAEAADDVDPLA